MQINLDFDKRSGPGCPHCQESLPRNKVGRRAVMDCPMPHGSMVYLTFPTALGFCRSCERYVTSCPQVVQPDCHATLRLMRLVSEWAGFATNSEVAAMFKIVLTQDTPPPCLEGVTKLLIDEKSVRKGRCYVTIILNGETGELLHMQEGRKRNASNRSSNNSPKKSGRASQPSASTVPEPIRPPSRPGSPTRTSSTIVFIW